MKNDIVIHDVGLRDGLQIEKEPVPLDRKIKWLNDLIASGLTMIQPGSFVHPKKVPQMATTDELFKAIYQSGTKPDNVILSALVLNEKGLERGLDCGVEMFCMGVSASNTHSQKNTGMTTTEALTRVIAMSKKALTEKKKVQVSVQSAFGCGYEGKIANTRVKEIVQQYLDAGLTTVSLADTAGYAIPQQVHDLYAELMTLDPNTDYACHFHDTFGLGIVNSYEAWKSGVKYFESSSGGLGGCPFTKIKSGNVCTEDLVYFFQRYQSAKNIHLEKLLDLTKDISGLLNRELSGRIYKTGLPNL